MAVELPVTMRKFGIIEAGNRSGEAVLQTPFALANHRERMTGMSSVSPTSKTCTKCGIEKPLAEFYSSKKGLYGKRADCKPCYSAGRSAYGRRMRQEHPDIVRKWARNNYQNHREKRDAGTREYARKNPWMDRYKYRRLRAIKQGAEVVRLTAHDWWECLDYFGHRCAYCNDPLPRDEQDHIIPLSKGGNHTIDNVVPACLPCNASKNNHALITWMWRGGRKT